MREEGLRVGESSGAARALALPTSARPTKSNSTVKEEKLPDSQANVEDRLHHHDLADDQDGVPFLVFCVCGAEERAVRARARAVSESGTAAGRQGVGVGGAKETAKDGRPAAGGASPPPLRRRAGVVHVPVSPRAEGERERERYQSVSGQGGTPPIARCSRPPLETRRLPSLRPVSAPFRTDDRMNMIAPPPHSPQKGPRRC